MKSSRKYLLCNIPAGVDLWKVLENVVVPLQRLLEDGKILNLYFAPTQQKENFCGSIYKIVGMETFYY